MKLLIYITFINIFLALIAPNAIVPLNQDVDLAFRVIGNKVQMYIHKKVPGHYSMGFGSHDMDDSNVVLINKITNGNDIEVLDCYSFGEMTLDCSKQQNFVILQKTVTQNNFEVIIERDLSVPNDKLAKDFFINQRNEVIFSYTNADLLEYHYGTTCKFGSFIYDYQKNAILGMHNKKVEGGVPGGLVHSFANIFLWIFLEDALIIVGRFLKTFKHYNNVHTFLNVALTIYTYIVIAAMFAKRNISARKKPKHFLASISIIIFLALIFINGILNNLIIMLDIKSLNKLNKKYLRWIHLILGIIVWICVRVTCYYGALYTEEIYHTSVYLYVLIVETIIFLIICIIWSVIYQFNYKFIKIRYLDEQKIKNNKLMGDKIELKSLNLDDLKKSYPDLTIVLYNNRVFNISNFIHPGGKFILNQLKFRDVGRYIIGAFGI